MQLFNTLGRRKEDLGKPAHGKAFRVYTCGPTVYDFAHIGNLSSYLFVDLLIRTLENLEKTPVRWAMNLTDVGHLTEDDIGVGDGGEDKLEKGARREGKTPREVANFFTEEFLKDSRKLRFREPDERPRATDFIEEQLELVEKLIDAGFAY